MRAVLGIVSNNPEVGDWERVGMVTRTDGIGELSWRGTGGSVSEILGTSSIWKSIGG